MNILWQELYRNDNTSKSYSPSFGLLRRISMGSENEKGGMQKKIVVMYDGPYVVHGAIPLIRKTQVVSEYGEPLTWKTGELIETSVNVQLCRCGHSNEKPFCDGTHIDNEFDGTETADPTLTSGRQEILENGKNILVKRDYSLCMESGFCATRFANIENMLPETDDTRIRSLVIAMIERCPSGSFTYAIQKGEKDIEPDLPQQIAVTTDITSDGSIMGALWVTGNIPIVRADGKPFEIRNRVTLCRCGLSKIKPLCDGEHRVQYIKDT
jgi:CDGSH-type Zn-finger protein